MDAIVRAHQIRRLHKKVMKIDHKLKQMTETKRKRLLAEYEAEEYKDQKEDVE